jgi:hypothetical protein
MSLNTNLPNGVTNVPLSSTGGYMPELDSPVTIEYFEDFSCGSDVLIATPGSYTVTNADSSTIAAVASGSGAYGGAVLLTVGAATINHFYEFQMKGAPFALTATTKWSLAVRMQVHTTNTVAIAGVGTITATPFTSIVDGIWFSSAVGGAISLNVSNTSVVSSISMGTFVADTYITLGARYNSDSGVIEALVNNAVVGNIPTTNVPTAVISPLFGILNGTAAAVNAKIDYINFKQVR